MTFTSGLWQYSEMGDKLLSVDKYLGYSDNIIIPSIEGGKQIAAISKGLLTRRTTVRSVTIPPSIERICAGAFKNCSELRRVDGCEGLKVIGRQAFLGCLALESIPLSTVEEIEQSAFSGCTSLKSISLKSARIIEKRAFFSCVSLREISIPSCTEKLEEGAFGSCEKLENVRLPSSLYSADRIATTFGGTPFCTHSQIMRTPNSAAHSQQNTNSPDTVSASDGYTLVKNSDGTWAIKEYTGSDTGVEVVSQRSDGRVVTKILTGAFSKCSAQTVYIGEGISEIAESAFRGNSSLIYAELPDSLKKLGSHAFEDCTRLVNARLPYELYHSDRIASCFRNTPFFNAMSGKPFDSSADAIIKANPDGTGAMKTYIGHMSDVTLKSGLPGGIKITKILPQAFRCRQDVKTVNVPEGYTEICSDAFSDCTDLTFVSLPDSIQTLGKDAFRGCGSLRKLRIPEHLRGTEMLKKALKGTPAGKELFGAESTQDCGKTYTCVPVDGKTYALKKYSGPDEVVLHSQVGKDSPKKITKILANAFIDCDPTSVKILDGYREICTDAFADCKKLTKVVIPNSVYLLEIYVFRGCTALTDVQLPPELNDRRMLISAFKGTPFGKRIKNEPDTYAAAGGEVLKLNADGTWALAKYAGGGSVAMVRAEIDGKRITKILGGAFAGKEDIVSVFIGEGITEIDADAFSGCSALSFAALPKSLTELSKDAFAGCGELVRVMMPSSMNIRDRIKSVFSGTLLGGSYDLVQPSFPDNSEMVILYGKKQESGFVVDLEDMLNKRNNSIKAKNQ